MERKKLSAVVNIPTIDKQLWIQIDNLINGKIGNIVYNQDGKLMNFVKGFINL
jgi:hypothetical protein